jgi:succinate dehydrogenase / fumarate reductase membrane anchor subunit
MVKSVTSLTRSGLRDWLIQRVSAVVLGVYIIFLSLYIFSHPQLDFIDWSGLFAHQWMRYFSMLALVSLIFHSWVGVWTIATDYLKDVSVRLIFLTLVVLALLVYLFWGLDIIFKWGYAAWV